MQKLMKRLFPISLFLVVLVSCKSYEIHGFEKKERNITAIQNNYFSDLETDYVYKAHIEVYGTDLSGIFVVKKINELTHRVVLTTDFGNKLLDFELSESDFKVNYITADLDKKIVINTLKKDFRLLLKNHFAVDEMYENEQETVFKSKDGNHFNYIIRSKENHSITELRYTSSTKEKVVFKFVPQKDTFAEFISIQHYNIKLKIELNQINN